MNKTININLANMFFHIDEDAYTKLQRYLNAIKRSFTDSQGRDEIIADIEARVAELFSERLKNERQVISTKEVQEVIDIMGQPEDYLVDDEIFEDDPRTVYQRRSDSVRKLYRDFDNKYIAGVCAGLGQYFRIDPLWIRLAAVVFTLAGFGTPILAYVILWIVIPKANTTTEKLVMAGKPANISNIEKKIKEGFDGVHERISDVDFEKAGQRAKKGASSFFDAIGDVLVTLLKVIGKIFGIIFIIIASITLVSAIVSAFAISFFNLDSAPGDDWLLYHDLGIVNTMPQWILGILLLLALGIPALALFILGIKILVKNSKSIGTPAKIAMVVLWVGAVMGISYIGSNIAMHHTIEATVSERAELPVKANDTIQVKMIASDEFNYNLRSYRHDYEVEYNRDDERILFSRAVKLIVKPTDSENARVKISKNAGGHSYDAAKERAGGIDYNYVFEDNTLKLNGFFLFDPNDKHNQQEVFVTLYLPEGTILYADENTRTFHSNDWNSGDILGHDEEEKYLQVIDDDLKCLNCDEERLDVSDETEENTSNENSNEATNNAVEENTIVRDSIRTDSIN